MRSKLIHLSIKLFILVVLMSLLAACCDYQRLTGLSTGSGRSSNFLITDLFKDIVIRPVINDKSTAGRLIGTTAADRSGVPAFISPVGTVCMSSFVESAGAYAEPFTVAGTYSVVDQRINALSSVRKCPLTSPGIEILKNQKNGESRSGSGRVAEPLTNVPFPANLVLQAGFSINNEGMRKEEYLLVLPDPAKDLAQLAISPANKKYYSILSGIVTDASRSGLREALVPVLAADILYEITQTSSEA